MKQLLKHRYTKITLLITSILFLFTGIAMSIAYSKRDAILNKMYQKAILKAKNNYQLDIQTDTIYFSGISTLVIKNLTVVPADRDSLCQFKNLEISVRIFPLIFGNIKLSKILIDQGNINTVFKKEGSNLDFLLKKKSDSTQNTKEQDLATSSYHLIQQLLYKIPYEMEINQLNFKLNDHDSAGFNLQIPNATVNGGDLKGTLKIDQQPIILMKGVFDPNDNALKLQLIAQEKNNITFDYLEKKLHLKFNFTSVTMALNNVKSESGSTKIYTSWECENFHFFHPKIASTYLEIPEGKFDANIFIEKNALSLDRSSTFKINKFEFNPYVKITLGKKKIYALAINAPKQEAQNFIDAFPKGTFQSFENMKVKGDLSYQMNFLLDSKKPDAVQFDSDLKSYDFKIEKMGKVDFRKIAGPFTQAIYEKGKHIRDLVVGPSNPNYTAYKDISPDLIKTVLTSEDPSFYENNGFVLASIKKSITVNFKEKKFKRGASTISMQLVKNAFLNREKTLTRKIEEMAIVWLIHDQKLVSKQRMLEVYFNIIEFGKNIYGIGEATNHYFNFRPNEIGQGQALFFANIIPSPKKALNKFTSDGHLKHYLLPYFRFIGNIMARKGIISHDDQGYGYNTVLVSPSLRAQLDPPSITEGINTGEIEDMGNLADDFKRQNPDIKIINNESPVIKLDTLRIQQSKLMDSIDRSNKELSKSELRKMKRADRKNK